MRGGLGAGTTNGMAKRERELVIPVGVLVVALAVWLWWRRA